MLQLQYKASVISSYGMSGYSFHFLEKESFGELSQPKVIQIFSYSIVSAAVIRLTAFAQ